MNATIPTITSITRPTSGLTAGDQYFETDTKSYIIWDGTVWRTYDYDDIALPTVADNHSLSLDGTDDYLTTNHHFSDIFSGSFSISVWVKTASSFSGRGADNLMAIYDGVALATGQCYMEYRIQEVSATTAKLNMYFEESYSS